jgi:hypothetical protein
MWTEKTISKNIGIQSTMPYLDYIDAEILKDLIERHNDLEDHIRAIKLKILMPKTMGGDNGKGKKE